MENEYHSGDHYPFPGAGLPAVQISPAGDETAGVSAAFLFLDARRFTADLLLYLFIGAADQVTLPGGLSRHWQHEFSVRRFSLLAQIISLMFLLHCIQ